MKKSNILYVFLVIFLIGVAYIVLTLSTGTTSFFGKAAGSGVFTAANSYLFASPLTGRINGDKIRVTVFALDGQGKGVAAKPVSINCKDLAVCQQNGIILTPVQPETDTLGQAIYDISSPKVGKFELQAIVSGVVIPQTVTVTFQ